MKTKAITGLLACLVLAAMMAGNLSAQNPPSQEEIMQKWMELATPGEPHKLLNALVGTWDIASKSWMAGPDQPPAESRGTSTISWILDNHFLQEEMTWEMMGRAMKGIGLVGYDNLKKKYLTFWIDNSGTAMYLAEGSYSPDQKTFTFFGSMDDPITGEHDKTMMLISRTVDDNTRTWEMHDLSLGAGRSKVAEMTCTRKK